MAERQAQAETNAILGPKRQFGGGLKRAFWWTLLWEPRDLWLGIYWDRPKGTGWSRALDVYVCVVPCLPVKLTFRQMLPDPSVMAG